MCGIGRQRRRDILASTVRAALSIRIAKPAEARYSSYSLGVRSVTSDAGDDIGTRNADTHFEVVLPEGRNDGDGDAQRAGNDL
jgi:hypothetical protein